MRGFFGRWFVTAVAVLAAAHLVNGLSYDGYGSLAVAALLLGILNVFLRPVLLFLSLPFLLLSFGLFTFVINAFLFYMVGWLVKGFYVASFWSAFWGALVVSLVSFLLNSLVFSRGKVTFYRRGADGNPVIDV